MSRKEELIKVAKETVQMIRTGKYEVRGVEVNITDILQTSIKEAYFIGRERVLKISAEYKTKGIIKVQNMSTLGAFEEYEGSGKVGILNFASAKNPCGGFLNGVFTQEESLAYCTDMYNTLNKFKNEYYEANRKNMYGGLYTDRMIVSPKSVVFRGNDLKTRISGTACIVTCPAVNRGVALQSKIKDSIIEKTMENRIRKILIAMENEGCKTIILGAYGCGVFKNKATVVARIFKKLLIEEQFANCFERIVFAIPGGENLRAFEEVFKGFK